MAVVRDTSAFFLRGTASQYEHVFNLYQEALKLKAQEKNKKPEELIKLDNWYQNDLPKLIKTRGKDMHLSHEELVQMMKWKLARGKFYPHLSNLIKINTPKAVITETKKALKKLPNLEAATVALNNLKGVGTTMASAVLAAGAPELAPFMADECLMAIPEIESIDYTTNEYLKFVDHMKAVAERLNGEVTDEEEKAKKWNPHKVEMAIWAYFILRKSNAELLNDLPDKENLITNGNGTDNGVDEDSNPTQDSSTKDSVDSEVQDESSNPAIAGEESSNPPGGFDETSNPPAVSEENGSTANGSPLSKTGEESSDVPAATAEEAPSAKRQKVEE
ncbi:uncharacterized protein LOC136040086 isoform X3 [Artemia franciscana]|uniref:Uncharacterized protein n=1 Tax=Artemia franciscana TaxID=6661 RepID=A0AA88HYU0_ARTSF|nr:hypothetical protein QYM36_009120 [Artemia franciscana]